MRMAAETRRRLSLHVDVDSPEEVSSLGRTASAASSALDSYYFDSSLAQDNYPPLRENSNSIATPDYPATPAKDPASIDRRALVGVGELATPRWSKTQNDAYDPPENDTPDDHPDSPWTIEAVDGDAENYQELTKEPLQSLIPPQPLRSVPSSTSESGGEEILYPRTAHVMPPPSPPPTSFSQQPRRARKRTSDEFEMDQQGSLVSKRDAPKDRDKRKHQSLGARPLTSPKDARGRERRRDSVGLSISANMAKLTPGRDSDKHTRHSSTSSSSDAPPRRVPPTDFSHLPPSPSTTSIRQFLKQASSPSSSAKTPPPASVSQVKDPHVVYSPNVAHSLLRGTQEGWSAMDDEATTEALRKLDGMSGKTARARASVGSFHRSSRPGTPAKSASQQQWEGIEGSTNVRRKLSSKDLQMSSKDVHSIPAGDVSVEEQSSPAAFSSDDHSLQSTSAEKTPRRASVRGSITGKRASASSTNYTPTSSSRDSTSMSASTSVTSMSAPSSRHSNKAKRNSAGSDISTSSDATSLKDRVAALAVNAEHGEERAVPPVPPLPKDLVNYKSPPASSTGLTFPAMDDRRSSHESQQDRPPPPGDNTSVTRPARASTSSNPNATRNSQLLTPDAAPLPQPVKTPSKKWSFSNALKLASGSSPSSPKREFSLSPRTVSFGHHLRKSASKDQALSPSHAPSQQPVWSQSDAMNSASSLASLSSLGSAKASGSATLLTSEHDVGLPRRSDTASSNASNNTTSALAPSQHPGSPTASVRKNQSKRLTPSSIPFFRRSSSQSMHLSSNSVTYAGPASPSIGQNSSVIKEKGNVSPDSHAYNTTSSSVSASASRKSSLISLGLPSLLKSSSRRSLAAEAKEGASKDTTPKARDSALLSAASKEREKLRLEKDRLKKEDKERADSRISSLMGRKRGKTLSSTDPKKPKSPVSLPPMQVAALEPATTQRVARLKSNASSSDSSSPPSKTPTTSRVTAQTVSSMQKQSDASLRSTNTRNQLPTIAGSPSVGNNNLSNSSREISMPPPAAPSSATSSSLPKETPTKIPRISSRTSGISSPAMKGTTPATRRTSVNATSRSNTAQSSSNSSPTANEFGVMENGDSTPKTVTTKQAVRASPTTASTSLVTNSTSRPARQSTIGSSSSSGAIPRKSNRDSITFSGLRKASAGSASASNTSSGGIGNTSNSSSHRFSALSPSKGLKLLSPKISLQSARTAASSSSYNVQPQVSTPSSGRQSLTTPSPSPNQVDDDERLGDEEMMSYIKRQQQKKLSAGASPAELEDLLKFPEPIAPTAPLSPSAVLKGSQNTYLSDYERQEVLEYPKVYYVGQRSRKKMATPDNSTNNFGYDDERGDYLVVTKDHLAYRYEVVDTLGKGSFGQVLHCRDHCTGESVAIKIIRNKKRFHHQALVEIKILDNLRKWDAEQKHHVIMMTDHFYFRNHLCIAMELLSINLYELIKANGFVGFTTNLIRRFTAQMLLSLSLMRHHRIVHCDLKPENVLLRHPSKSALKVIDFGSSCFEHEKIYTYIQSRFYRSPEVILGMNYHMAIDMWSLGCILAELYTGFPIFPGENEQEQLACIMEVLGAPDKDFINRSPRKKLFFDTSNAPRAVVNSKGRRRRPGTKTLTQVLRCSDEDFVDFISKCLMWDPERRMKPQAALRHPFVTAGRRPKAAATPSKNVLSSSALTGSSRKHGLTTPKKSDIGAPTPLTARTSRTNGTTGQPTTPSSVSVPKSFRSSQSNHSSRTSNGLSV